VGSVLKLNGAALEVCTCVGGTTVGEVAEKEDAGVVRAAVGVLLAGKADVASKGVLPGVVKSDDESNGVADGLAVKVGSAALGEERGAAAKVRSLARAANGSQAMLAGVGDVTLKAGAGDDGKAAAKVGSVASAANGSADMAAFAPAPAVAPPKKPAEEEQEPGRGVSADAAAVAVAAGAHTRPPNPNGLPGGESAPNGFVAGAAGAERVGVEEEEEEEEEENDGENIAAPVVGLGITGVDAVTAGSPKLVIPGVEDMGTELGDNIAGLMGNITSDVNIVGLLGHIMPGVDAVIVAGSFGWKWVTVPTPTGIMGTLYTTGVTTGGAAVGMDTRPVVLLSEAPALW
jgi:hypothetical protein